MLDGPAIYAAGAILSTTGGHGDLHSYPLPWMEDYARLEGTMRLADGEAGCQRAAREQLRRGARLIKVCAFPHRPIFEATTTIGTDAQLPVWQR